MKTKIILLYTGLLFLAFIACHKEHSIEGGKILNIDTLPSDYPFATGYCDGVTLGIPIADTNIYTPSSSDLLPSSLQLGMAAAGNQGSQGSCAAWATIYGVGSYYSHLTTGKDYSDTGNLSPRFTYNQITKGNCTCTSLLDNLYLLKTQGACSLAAMPYDPGECLIQPDSLQRKRAEIYKITDWRKVDLHNLTLIKRAIAEKKPVLFAIRVDEGFENMTVPYVWKERVGTLKLPHAMVITGYDDLRNCFRIMNSWSTGWGDKGFIWIDYDFFLQNVLERGYIVI